MRSSGCLGPQETGQAWQRTTVPVACRAGPPASSSRCQHLAMSKQALPRRAAHAQSCLSSRAKPCSHAIAALVGEQRLAVAALEGPEADRHPHVPTWPCLCRAAGQPVGTGCHAPTECSRVHPRTCRPAGGGAHQCRPGQGLRDVTQVLRHHDGILGGARAGGDRLGQCSEAALLGQAPLRATEQSGQTRLHCAPWAGATSDGACELVHAAQ